MNLLKHIAVVLVLSSSAWAQGPFTCQGKFDPSKVTALIAEVETNYRRIDGLQADFQQESLFLGFGEKVSSSGQVLFKKPGMMDWSYQQPEPQRFVADGRTLWFFQPEMNQVTIGQFQQSFQSGLPVSFLLGLGSLAADFNVKDACTVPLGVALTLEPRSPDPSLQSFKLLVDPKQYLPIGALVVDVGGNETQIVFTNLKPKIDVANEHFQFIIPKGVDVIDQRNGSGVVQ